MVSVDEFVMALSPMYVLKTGVTPFGSVYTLYILPYFLRRFFNLFAGF
jgi:hypothetical protein